MSTGENSLSYQKIDLTPFPCLYREENIFLHRLFKKYGFELRICGGAVRDVLLGITPKDIDFATNATPTQMNEMFLKENIRTLNRNGEAHGTVTVRINDSVNFEVTTLRIDVDPDGRHAKVVFTNDWKLDAERRDLTVNSMFIAIDLEDTPVPSESLSSSGCATDGPPLPIYGHVYDFFNGRDDLMCKRIRFVGDPTKRIREDYLRILRYFRFHGRLVNEDSHDAATVKAISGNSGGLASIAGERCWVELKNILTCQSTPSLLRRMHDLGIFPYIGFPNNPSFEELDRLWKHDILTHSPNPVTCLSALISTLDEVETVNNRLKFSNQELMLIIFIVRHRVEFMNLTPDNALERCRHRLLLSQISLNKLRPILVEMMYYMGLASNLVDRLSSWEAPRFPVSGFELQEKWSIPPRELRKNIWALKRQWVDSGCTMERNDLLSEQNRASLQLPSELPDQFELDWLKKKCRH